MSVPVNPPLFTYGPTQRDQFIAIVLALLITLGFGIMITVKVDFTHGWAALTGKDYGLLFLGTIVPLIPAFAAWRTFAQRVEFFDQTFDIYDRGQSKEFRVESFKTYACLRQRSPRSQHVSFVLFSPGFSQALIIPGAEYNREADKLNQWVRARFTEVEPGWATFEHPVTFREMERKLKVMQGKPKL
jgi:hypothetical protein